MRFIMLALGILASAPALGATYSFFSSPYTQRTPCTAEKCSNYAPLSRVSGKLETRDRLPPNLVAADIGAYLTGFSVTDGLVQYSMPIRGYGADTLRATTDGTGQITSLNWSMNQWRFIKDSPYTPGDDLISRLDITAAGVRVQNDLRCTAFGRINECVGFSSDAGSSSAGVNAPLNFAPVATTLPAGHIRMPDPEPGLWAVDAELNGKPGRGFQIDMQGGSRVVFSYFGYRQDGSSQFLQASGKVERWSEDGFFPSLSAPLLEYRGGTAIGTAYRPAAEAGNLGYAYILFLTSSTGILSLPGEEPKRISRFRYEDLLERFNQQYYLAASVLGGFGPFSQRFATLTAKDNVFTMSETYETYENSQNACEYRGNYTLTGRGLNSVGSYTCTSASNPTQTGEYRFEELNVDIHGVLTGRMYQYATETQYMGVCKGQGAVTGYTIPRCKFFKSN